MRRLITGSSNPPTISTTTTGGFSCCFESRQIDPNRVRTFGTGGIVTTIVGVESRIAGVALQPNGDIVVAGSSYDGSH
jgi:hypothetical protein